MRIFVTGGTGFVGHATVKKLLQRNYTIALLARSQMSLDSIGPLPDKNKILPVYGSIYDVGALREGMKDCGAVVHLVGIIREAGENTFEKAHYEGAVNVMEAAKSLGIHRFILMSAEGTRAAAASRYHQTKFKAEEHLRSSGLAYTIMRPSMMFGPEDKNFNVLAQMIAKTLIVPIIGNGDYVWQPVSVQDVAGLIALSIECKAAEGKTYEIRGPEAFTFNQIIDLLMGLLGVKKPKLHIPVAVIKPIMSVLGGLLPLPITKDQLIMLLDQYELPKSNFQEDFPMSLATIKEELSKYIARRRK